MEAVLSNIYDCLHISERAIEQKTNKLMQLKTSVLHKNQEQRKLQEEISNLDEENLKLTAEKQKLQVTFEMETIYLQKKQETLHKLKVNNTEMENKLVGSDLTLMKETDAYVNEIMTFNNGLSVTSGVLTATSKCCQDQISKLTAEKKTLQCELKVRRSLSDELRTLNEQIQEIKGHYELKHNENVEARKQFDRERKELQEEGDSLIDLKSQPEIERLTQEIESVQCDIDCLNVILQQPTNHPFLGKTVTRMNSQPTQKVQTKRVHFEDSQLEEEELPDLAAPSYTFHFKSKKSLPR